MPKLYLIPNFLTDEAKANAIAGCVAEAIEHIRLFFVEEPKSARALLRKLNPNFPLAEWTFLSLNEHTSTDEVKNYLSQS